MRVPPRRYQAMGAAIVAGAITARYVAKWRRRRSRRLGEQLERDTPTGRYFIGVDLTDPAAGTPRPCDVAVLDGDLTCIFSQWDYREDGLSIVPPMVVGRPFVLAIDGPQGLAGQPGATVRESERIVNAPGRTPYELPSNGRPYSGFIAGSVRLFHSLVTSGARFRLLGLNDVPVREANLMEVFPGGGWRVLAGSPLPAKRSAEGRRRRFDLLGAQGVSFPNGPVPTDDQLDAAMAAWTAYCMVTGNARLEGGAPVLDASTGVIREGYIVQPAGVPAAAYVEGGPVAPV